MELEFSYARKLRSSPIGDSRIPLFSNFWLDSICFADYGYG